MRHRNYKARKATNTKIRPIRAICLLMMAHDGRRPVRETSKDKMSALELWQLLNLRVTTRNIQQILHQCPHLRYVRVICVPKINEKDVNVKDRLS